MIKYYPKQGFSLDVLFEDENLFVSKEDTEDWIDNFYGDLSEFGKSIIRTTGVSGLALHIRSGACAGTYPLVVVRDCARQSFDPFILVFDAPFQNRWRLGVNRKPNLQEIGEAAISCLTRKYGYDTYQYRVAVAGVGPDTSDEGFYEVLEKHNIHFPKSIPPVLFFDGACNWHRWGDEYCDSTFMHEDCDCDPLLPDSLLKRHVIPSLFFYEKNKESGRAKFGKLFKSVYLPAGHDDPGLLGDDPLRRAFYAAAEILLDEENRLYRGTEPCTESSDLLGPA